MKISWIWVPVCAFGLIAGCSEPTRQRLEDKADAAAHRTESGIDNATLTTTVKAKIAADTRLGTLTSINVDSNDGKVTLSGTVRTTEEKKRVEAVASSVSGVRTVVNNLEVGG